MKGRLLYKEEQTFIFTWSWWMVTLISVPVLILMIRNYFQEIGSDQELTMMLITLFTFMILAGTIWLFSVMKLVMKIDAGSLYYSFYPFVGSMKSLKKEELKALYIRKYRPIREYGGWGYRVRFKKGKAFSVSGNWGLQLKFKNGNKLLLGTQNPKELEEAITKLKENWGMND